MPIVISVWVEQFFWAFVLCWAQVFILWCLNAIAIELENPFGQDPNDFDACHLQRVFNVEILLLLDPKAERVPELSTQSIMDGQKISQIVSQASLGGGGHAVDATLSSFGDMLAEIDVSRQTTMASSIRPSGASNRQSQPCQRAHGSAGWELHGSTGWEGINTDAAFSVADVDEDSLPLAPQVQLMLNVHDGNVTAATSSATESQQLSTLVSEPTDMYSLQSQPVGGAGGNTVIGSRCSESGRNSRTSRARLEGIAEDEVHLRGVGEDKVPMEVTRVEREEQGRQVQISPDVFHTMTPHGSVSQTMTPLASSLSASSGRESLVYLNDNEVSLEILVTSLLDPSRKARVRAELVRMFEEAGAVFSTDDINLQAATTSTQLSESR